MTPDIGLAMCSPSAPRARPSARRCSSRDASGPTPRCSATSRTAAGRLAALGVAKGERVAFLGHNQPMFLIAMFAAARLGAIFVPLNFRLTGPELAFMLADCAARVLIVDEAHRPVIAPAARRP